MITLKFEWYLHDSDYVDNKDDSTKVTEIVEAHRDLWHRSFTFKSVKQYEDWLALHNHTDNGWIIHVGHDPASWLADIENQGSKGVVNIEYITFYDAEEKFNRYIMLDAKCFIMNSYGQTIDTILT